MGYIHGYNEREQERLFEQARFLEEKVFESLDLGDCRNMLEVGCGTGAECEILLRRNPLLHVTGIDISAEQVAKAEEFMREKKEYAGRYEFKQANGRDLSELAAKQFDSAFYCWLLEHVPEPVRLLSETRKVMRPGGKIFLTEVYNASLRIEPEIPVLLKYWEKYNELQAAFGGDPHVGIKLGLHLHKAGFQKIRAWNKTFLFDARVPEARREMLKYWLGLMLSASDQLIARGMVSQGDVNSLRAAFKEAQEKEDCIFYYSFFQAEGER